MKIAVIPNYEKDKGAVVTGRLIEKLSKLDCEFAVTPAAASMLNNVAVKEEEQLYKDSDVIIAVGGDGTIIHAAKAASVYNKPVLGLSSGRLGYIASLEANELDLLDRLVQGNYEIEERMMLTAWLKSDPDKRYRCLNDAVVSKVPYSHILDIQLSANGAEILKFRADGLVVSTPTGSTAYSLSAGGPITDPSIMCMVVSMICPMGLMPKTMVLSADNMIEAKIIGKTDCEAFIAFDGADGTILHAGDTVCIKRSTCHSAKLIRIKEESFLQRLKNKMTNI